jgi:hypothetical protein
LAPFVLTGAARFTYSDEIPEVSTFSKARTEFVPVVLYVEFVSTLPE